MHQVRRRLRAGTGRRAQSRRVRLRRRHRLRRPRPPRLRALVSAWVDLLRQPLGGNHLSQRRQRPRLLPCASALSNFLEVLAPDRAYAGAHCLEEEERLRKWGLTIGLALSAIALVACGG